MEDILIATFITALGAFLTIFVVTIKGFKDTDSLQKDHQSILDGQKTHTESIIV
ncbi:TPA: hypothetical protein LLA94_001866, partial [Enterococcus faecium]|nr:hypothetical protein [Enterococcus faecium]